VGNAFDVVCERKQTDYRHLASDTWEVAYEIRLRNHKTLLGADEIERDADFLTRPERASTRKPVIEVDR